MTKNIILVGFMGSGKTTVGKALAKSLNYNFIDTDDLVELNEGTTISEIFEKKGERYFRELESDALSQSIGCTKTVISTGGGIVTIERNKQILSKEAVVYLKASPKQIYNNVKHDQSRPLLQGGNVFDKIRKMLKQRQIHYAQVAEYTVEVDGKTPQEIADLIVRRIK